MASRSTRTNNIHHNKSRLNISGIEVNGEDNVIHDNNFFINLDEDCVDDTSGGGTAETANNWWNDLGIRRPGRYLLRLSSRTPDWRRSRANGALFDSRAS